MNEVSRAQDGVKVRRVFRRMKRTRVVKTIVVDEEEFIVDKPDEAAFEIRFPRFEKVTFDTAEVPSGSKVSAECADALSIDDLEERKELARIVGLTDVPLKDVSAFDELIGIADDLTGRRQTDAVELVRSLRRRR